MKGILFVLCAFLTLGAPAFGQTAEDFAPVPTVYKTGKITIDPNGRIPVTPPLREWYTPEDVLLAAVPPKKSSFAMKHPKLHKAGRRLRRTCQICQPVVSFLGSVGQCVTPFVIH